MHDRLRRWLVPLQRTPLHPQWFAFRGERTWLLRVAQAARGRVIEIGCGRQRVRSLLGTGCEYVGLDYPRTAVALYGSRPHIFGDGQRLPLADGCADTVLMLEVLEHVPQPELAFAEAARVLRPGGTLVTSVPFLYPLHDAPFDFQRWTPAGLEALLRRHAIEPLQVEAAGHPAETAALLMNIALARLVLDLAGRRNPLCLVLLLACVILVPAGNLAGWLGGRLGHDTGFMPHSCRAFGRRRNPTAPPPSAK